MKIRNALTAAISVAFVAAATLLAAPAASADQVWYQGVERASADAPCPASSADDLTAGWSEWTPSWAQWANSGRGGYVCTRSITWAHEDAGGGGQICIPIGNFDELSLYVLLPSWHIAGGTELGFYQDSGCFNSISLGGPPPIAPWDLVWAPGGEDHAAGLCHEAFGQYTDPEREYPGQGDDDTVPDGIWFCIQQV